MKKEHISTETYRNKKSISRGNTSIKNRGARLGRVPEFIQWRYEDILFFASKGLSVYKIANTLGVSESVVKSFLNLGRPSDKELGIGEDQ